MMKNLKMKAWVTMIALVLTIQTGFGQNSLTELEYGAYLSSSKTLWKNAVSKRKSAYSKSKELRDLFSLAKAQYGLLAVTMIDQDEDLFDAYIDQTKENIETLIEEGYNLAETKAIMSALYGQEMAYSSWKGMYLGAKSSGLIDDAIKLDNTSPLVWQIYGSAKLFTPAMFGGDQNEAVKAFEKSVKLYEKNPDASAENFRYLDALAWLGQAYEKTNQKEKAIATYKKALEVEPDFNWVKKNLLPKISQQ